MGISDFTYAKGVVTVASMPNTRIPAGIQRHGAVHLTIIREHLQSPKVTICRVWQPH